LHRAPTRDLASLLMDLHLMRVIVGARCNAVE